MQSPSSDVVKVAIQANNQAVLFRLEQDQSLEKVIKEICGECKVTYEKGKFALQLLPLVSETEVFVYITEFNRYMIKNGRELRLVYSPPLLAKMIKEKLNPRGSIENLTWALKKSAICSTDSTFCKEFYPTGYSALRDLLNELLLTKDLYKKSLQTILNLIKSNYLKDLDKDFLLQLKNIIISDQQIEEGIIETALEILEAIILTSGDSEFITKLLNLDELVHIWSRDSPTIQSNTIALMNTMALKSSKVKTQRLILQKMNSKEYKDKIYMNIITTDSVVPPNLAHVLYVYQSLILSLAKERYRNIIKSESLMPDLVPCLKTNKMDPKIKNEMEAEFFKLRRGSKISQTNVSYNDGDDISLTPSMTSSVLYGSQSDEEVDDTVFIQETKRQESKKDNYISHLTFDCVFYFYNNHRDDYKIALLDDGNNYSNLLRTCEQIVQILCLKVLRIGNIPENGETNYCPLIFFTAHPFLEELFSRAINLLHKTKREMRARSSSDLEKVYQVLHRQLSEALASQPTTFERLEAKLGNLSYWAVRNQWQEEQIERERHTLANSPAIKELKKSLEGEIKDLVKKQRLQFIKNETEFPVWNSQRNQRVKNKTWFAFLTPNEKVIQYYENEGEVKQMMVENIAAMLTGRRCPHIKHSKSRATNGELGFSLVAKDPTIISSLDFIAPTQEIYDHWTDAINILLGNEMRSLSLKRDMNCLLEMELRLRLLDTDGIDLPHDPPPIPLDPPNYDFSISQVE